MLNARYRTACLILIICFLPIFLSRVLYHSGYGRYHHNNRGTLIQSTQALTPPKKWLIASLPTRLAPPKNLKTVLMRKQALGKDQSRVDVVMLSNLATSSNNPYHLALFEASGQTIAYLSTLKTDDGLPCYYFIISPRGHPILCYAEMSSPKNIDQDLRKLLKYSRIG